MSLRIVSRGSALALWQAGAVRAALAAAGARAEVEVVRTTGDRIQDVPLSRIGDKGLFTKELDAALLEGRADLAVHSLKDVPTRLPEGLVLAAVTRREDPRDALLLPGGAAGSLDGLPAGARVGTSSLRRRAQLLARRPDLEVAELRGNLDTRIAKLDAGEHDAIVLAAAGVVRLGWTARIAERLDPPWLPAVGQGALAVVARADRADVAEALGALHDPATAAAVAAERALLRTLEGGCQVPVGALATVGADGRLVLDALVASLDGTRVVRAREEGAADRAEGVGLAAAEALLAAGAGAVLDEVRRAAFQPVPAAP